MKVQFTVKSLKAKFTMKPESFKFFCKTYVSMLTRHYWWMMKSFVTVIISCSEKQKYLSDTLGWKQIFTC